MLLYFILHSQKQSSEFVSVEKLVREAKMRKLGRRHDTFKFELLYLLIMANNISFRHENASLQPFSNIANLC